MISKTEDFTAIQANGPVITSVEQTQIASVSGRFLKKKHFDESHYD